MQYRPSTAFVALLVLSVAFGCSKDNEIDASQTTNICDEDTSDCVPCSPGEYKCAGATLEVCQQDGQGFDAVAMCVTEALCVKGLSNQLCAPAVCNPADTKCEGAKMWVCPPGQDDYVGTECPSVESCTAGLASGKCAAGECSGPTDCTGVDTECRKRTCEAGTCGFVNESPDTPCETNRKCDGEGNCVGQCNLPTDCTGVDTECRKRTCEAGWCGSSYAPAGAALTAQVEGDCKVQVCDGSGGVTILAESTDVPNDQNACTEDTCNGTSPEHGWAPSGTPCNSGGFCDGSGNCSACTQGERKCKDATTAQVCEGWWKDEPCTGLRDRCDQGNCVGGTTFVWVPAPGGTTYGIDATEVTRGQYEAWLSTSPTPSGQPSFCSWNSSPGSTDGTGFAPNAGCMSNAHVCQTSCDGRPQVCIDWCDAYAYCRAVGKRLCGRIGGGSLDPADYADAGASQWHGACTSGGQNDYPYGDAYDQNACNGEWTAPNSVPMTVGFKGTCQSPTSAYQGVYDLSGNVSEWEDACDGAVGAQDSCRIRGGSFYSLQPELACAAPSWSMRGFLYLDGKIGFRCCSDP